MAFRDGIAIFRQSGALPGSALDDLISQIRGLDMDEVRKQIAESREVTRDVERSPSALTRAEVETVDHGLRGFAHAELEPEADERTGLVVPEFARDDLGDLDRVEGRALAQIVADTTSTSPRPSSTA